MASFRVRGRTTGLVTTGNYVAALWNPHATKRITVTEVTHFLTVTGAAGGSPDYVRISARGTPGATVTPGIQQNEQRQIAPPSGALLDLAQYSVQPTADGANLSAWVYPTAIGSGFEDSINVVVTPGTGLAMVGVGATVQVLEVTFAWEE